MSNGLGDVGSAQLEREKGHVRSTTALCTHPEAVPKGNLSSRGTELVCCNSLKLSACNDFDLAAVQCEAVPISRCSGWKQKCFQSEAETWSRVLHIGSFTVQHWAASQPLLDSQIAKPPRCTWALRVTAHHQSTHTKNSSGKMRLKTRHSASYQQNATGSCCLFLATWQCIGYLWRKL